MTKPTDDGSSDADIKRTRVSPDIDKSSLHLSTDPTVVSSTVGSANTGPTLSSSSWYEYLPWSSPRLHDTIRLAGHVTKNKGKGPQRSVDWHMAIREASESEREGKLALTSTDFMFMSFLPPVHRTCIPTTSIFASFSLGNRPTANCTPSPIRPCGKLSLQIFTLLPAPVLLNCALVCKRWNSLANDQTLWRNLCHARGWEWRHRLIGSSPRPSDNIITASSSGTGREDYEDEGMGDEEEQEDEGSVADTEEVMHTPNGDVDPENESLSMNLSLQDHDFHSLIGQFVSTSAPTVPMPISRSNSTATTMFRTFSHRHVSPSSSRPGSTLSVDYRLLHQTQTLLRSRVRHGTYRPRTLPGAEGGGHAAAVYCLALWSYDSVYGPLQVLFTGSKDRTVREWDLGTNKVRRRAVGMHASSVLSLCVTATTVREDGACGSADSAREGHKNPGAGILVSGGSDCRVVVWDLAKFKSIKVLRDHQDSVLCVRVDRGRLVSCSKDRTIRTYSFPCLKPELVLRGHRAAVNAVSIAGDVIVSGSGDRSVRVWDARSGALINNFEDHHARAISSVELSPPFILSGSSDRHVRMFDMRTKRGWSTCPEFDNPTVGQPVNPLVMVQDGLGGEVPASASPFFLHSSLSQSVLQTRQEPQASEGEIKICNVCGTRAPSTGAVRGPERHSHPVRSVAIGDEFAVSGSYDCTVKVWDRTTGALVADLTGGHTGRIFCVAQDSTKIVSCGEDQRICIWDFSHGIDTSFIKL
ncbi:quinon protein alcohol dehydrogenase-like superfamily [Chiua virens]|nr:quinon protein alcohol dehydrogenase-like superfamily [Chiua virens]